MWTIVIFFIIIFLVFYLSKDIEDNKKNIARKSKDKKNEIEMSTYIGKMKHFKMTRGQFSIDDNLITDKCFAIDDRNNLMCILEMKNNIIEEKIYKYDDLYSSEIVENGNSVTKASLSDAFIGGALFGETGAIVGALTSKRTTSRNVNEISLIIIFNDTSNPVYKFNFMVSGGGGISRSDPLYKKNMEEVRNWHGILCTILKRKDDKMQTAGSVLEKTVFNASSTADEILKFNKLKEDGIITEDEFQKQKAKLL